MKGVVTLSKRTDYKNQYAKENYDRVGLMLPKGMKEQIKAHLIESGNKSINAFIIRTIESVLNPNHIVSDTMGVGSISYSKEYLQLIERQYDGEDVTEELENFDKDKMFFDVSRKKYLTHDMVDSLAKDFSYSLERSKFLLEVFESFCPKLSVLSYNHDLLEEFDTNFDDTESYYKNCM